MFEIQDYLSAKTRVRALAVWALAASPIAPAMAQKYTLVPLPFDQTEYFASNTRGINNANQVVGSLDLPSYDGASNAVIWNEVGNNIFAATNLAEVTNTAGVANGLAINDQGEVVGENYVGYEYPFGPVQAAIFTPTVAYTLDSAGYENSSAFGINDNGVIAGYSTGNVHSSGRAIQYPVVWMPHEESPTFLETLGGTGGTANAINDAGQVAGYAQLRGDVSGHAVIWNSGVATDLGTLGGTYSVANAINATGQVAGWADTSAGVQDAVIWDGAAKSDLGPGAATAINKYGQAVGTTPNGPALWAYGRTIYLNDLIPSSSGVTLVQPNGINDCGWIVVDGVSSANVSYVLIPVDSYPGC
jgi:probable HAF family extracellular repeat protein